MMRPMQRIWLFLFFIPLSAMAVPSVAPLYASEVPPPCEIFTRQDAEALFNETIPDGKTREASLPSGIACRYTFKKGENVYGITVRLSTSDAIVEEGLHDSAKDVFERQVKARRSNEEAAKKLVEIDDLGDGAFWEGTSLWTLQGDHLVIITVHSVLEGSFGSMDEMNAAQEEQDLELSVEVVRTVLERLE